MTRGELTLNIFCTEAEDQSNGSGAPPSTGSTYPKRRVRRERLRHPGVCLSFEGLKGVGGRCVRAGKGLHRDAVGVVAPEHPRHPFP